LRKSFVAKRSFKQMADEQKKGLENSSPRRGQSREGTDTSVNDPLSGKLHQIVE
jgi:hypothetical protein